MLDSLEGTTPVPNVFFDTQLSALKPAELKLLLVIIRNTLGWIDKRTRKRKQKDWLSGTQIRQKTGCSRRAITMATEALIETGLIEITDYQGELLSTPEMRRGRTKLYYRYKWEGKRKNHSNSCAKSIGSVAHNMHITKEKITKENTNNSQDKRHQNNRFSTEDLDTFKQDITVSGSLEQLLISKKAIKFDEGQRVIITYENPELYKKSYMHDYKLSGTKLESLRVPYSVWMEIYYASNSAPKPENEKRD